MIINYPSWQECCDKSEKRAAISDVQNWQHEVLSHDPGSSESPACTQGDDELVHKVLNVCRILNYIWDNFTTKWFLLPQVVTDEGENIYFYQQELKVTACKISIDNSSPGVVIIKCWGVTLCYPWMTTHCLSGAFTKSELTLIWLKQCNVYCQMDANSTTISTLWSPQPLHIHLDIITFIPLVFRLEPSLMDPRTGLSCCGPWQLSTCESAWDIF